MIPNLPVYISITFLVSVTYTYLIALKASQNHQAVRWGTLLWLIVAAVPALYGFFANTGTVPPRMPLLLAPSLIIILIAFATTKGKTFIDSLDNKLLTWLSLVRIPVEICLFWLFLEGHVPQVMTFEGRNLDILAGATAPSCCGVPLFQQKSIEQEVVLSLECHWDTLTSEYYSTRCTLGTEPHSAIRF